MRNVKMPKQAHQQRLHFGVSDTRSWRSQESRLFITRVLKLRNSKRQNPEIGTLTKTPFRSFADREFRVSDTESWRSQESRLFITGVPKLRNAKRRNPEIELSFVLAPTSHMTIGGNHSLHQKGTSHFDISAFRISAFHDFGNSYDEIS